MKKSIMLSLSLAVGSLAFSQVQVQTPAPSPKAKIEQKIGLTTFEINYSRPSLRNRDLHRDLVPLNKIWRFGANENTTITFDTPIQIDGQDVKAGTYAIFAIPSEDNWKLFLYNDYKGWGAPKELDNKKTALAFGVQVQKSKEKTETFTIAFDDLVSSNETVLSIKWADIILPIKIELPTKKLAAESIKSVIAKKPTEADFFRSASYYLNENIELDAALQYVDKAITLNPKAPTYYHHTKALIHEALGNNKEAIETARESMKLAEISGMDEYVRKNKDLIERLSKK